MTDLFGYVKPRAKPRKLMQVVDAGMFPDGKPCIQFICPHCGHDTDWIYDEWTLSENRRGQPCPDCNKDAEQPR